LKWLEEKETPDHLKELIKARHEYGLKKYGQGLMSEDGRNTMEDARQEAGDLLQYLFKATLQPRRPPVEEIKQIESAILHCLFLLHDLQQ
jgi:hypothetical protein